MNDELACPSYHFLGHTHLHAILLGHFLHKLAPKTAVNKEALDPRKERMLPQFSPPG
ncbi:hypothetical protein QMK33_17095 [Hymenobacter sp. H14-R3]|uniref:hypothetical protein n=1 Tax=Hymenobacter sp. H14-R3 TaxID=3046308 RepID=UPI0024BBC886|nr:hypothetical protein [Hymenobacter sp. H14-R3]MDJ0366871.1 hypothetical protein [Hymenobacter sp. H14-R3]